MTEKTAQQIARMKEATIGVEIEMNSITRKAAAQLAAAMNQMALTQRRVQAKEVDDSNEKYAFRTWLLRLGLNSADFKEDRRRLMANLSGNSAFRNDEEKARWTERQKAKREAQKAAAQQEADDTEGGKQHEVLDCD